MITEIRERIKVAALFGQRAKIRPVWFVWQGRKISIQKITYAWTERQGSEIYHHFSTTDGTALYELSYAVSNLSWELVAVESE